MKRLTILMAILVMITSCRVLKKNKVKADSTVARSETVAGTWDRVTVTEVFVPAKELMAVGVEFEGTTKDDVRLSGVEARSFLAKLFKPEVPRKTLTGKHFDRRAAPSAQPDKPQPLLSRTTTTERGTYSEHKQEQKQVHVQQKSKEVEQVHGWILPVMGVLLLLAVVAIIIYESKKRFF